MAEVSIPINGVTYKITCDDGQEARLHELASFFDSHVQQLAVQVGDVADSRLMLLAGLTVCDDLLETKAQLRNIQDQTGVVSEEGVADVLRTAAQKVRDVSNRLDNKAG